MKNINCKCLVIGGGAAGMMAAITAAENSKDVVLVEHTSRLGSKLLQTGNGKCNFTNLDMDVTKYNSSDSEFVNKVLEKFNVKDTLEFFEKIGIYHKEKNGYVYPNSETAASLQTALRMEIIHKRVNVITDCNIERIRHLKSGKDKYEILAGDICIYADAVILATGSMATPKTGSDGSGFELARQLGHTVNKVLPSLVQLESDDRFCKTMAGVRSTGKVELYSKKEKIAEDFGEIQYTNYGISGIPVFQISHQAVYLIDKGKKAEAVIDMLPRYTYDTLKNKIKIQAEYNKDRTVETFFSGLLNKKLVGAVAGKCGVRINDSIKDINEKKINEMIRTMKCYKMNITGFKSYDNAQVCQGGIKLSEIDENTMQSRLHKNLFFAGEMIDVDGKCGGYNLQWAWSTGYIAGKSAGC